jgi:uncharacterized protein
LFLPHCYLSVQEGLSSLSTSANNADSAPAAGVPAIEPQDVLVQSAASLPDLFVRASCDSERVFRGAVRLGDLPRLAQWVPSDEPGTLLVFSLRFFRDAGRDLLADISVQTTVQMDCARCLKPMTLPLVSESVLHFVYNDEQAQHVIDAREPILIDAEGSIAIAALLEEEVLMALPPVAMHAHQCRPAWQEAALDETLPTAPGTTRPNPFAALAKQWPKPELTVRDGAVQKSKKKDDE